MNYVKKLVGDNIYLAPIRTEDAEQFVEWLNDFPPPTILVVVEPL